MHRGAHRHGGPPVAESAHAAAAAARIEQAKVIAAQRRAAEVDAFMRDFRRAFGLGNGGTGAHR